MAEYNPYQDENPQTQGGGVVRAAFGLAKNIAVFGIVNLFGRVIARGASRGIANFVAKTTEGSFANIAKAMTARGETVSLGGIFAQTESGQKLNQIYSKATRGFSVALEERTRRIQAAQMMETGGFAKAAVTRFTSTFKDLKTFSGTIGSAFKRNVWAGAGVAYMIDNATGITRDMGIEKKPLWDVPGQVGNFAKWMGINTIFGLGFAGAGPIAKAIGGAGVRGLRTTLERNQPFVEKVIQGISRVSPGMPQGPIAERYLRSGNLPRSNYQKTFIDKAFRGSLAFQDTVLGSLKTIESTVRQSGEFVKETVRDRGPIIQRVRKNIGGPYKKALDDIKQQWARRRIQNVKPWSHPDYSGLKAVEFLHETAKRELQINHPGNRPKPGMDPIIPVLDKLNTKKTLLEEILPGLKAVRNKDVVHDDVWRTINKFVEKSPQNSALREFARGVKNMRTSDHVYTGYGVRGAGVDLSIFDPLKNARRVAGMLFDIPIHIPLTGLNFSAGSILHIDHILQEKPTVKFFDERPNLFGMSEQLDPDSLSLYIKDRGFVTYSNGTLHSLEWNKKLGYAPKSGTFRDNEIIRMNRKRRDEEMRKANAAMDRMSPDNNWDRFMGFLDKRLGMSIPSSMKDLFSGVERVLGGKKSYVEAAKLFGMPLSEINEDTWRKVMPVFGSIKEHASQEILPIMRTQKFAQLQGEAAQARLGLRDHKELFEIMNSDQALYNKLESISSFYKAKGWSFKKDTQDSIEMAKAFPGKASIHQEVKPLGRLSGMTAFDNIRVGLIDDIFSHQLLDDSNIPGAKDLLLLKTARELRNDGLITTNQEKAFKVHSFISQLENSYAPFKNTALPDGETGKLLETARQTAKAMGIDAEQDIISYISKTKMRRAPWTSTFERSFTPIKTNTPYISIPKNVGGAALEYGDAVFNTVGNLLSTVFPFRRDKYQHFGVGGNLKYLGGSVAKLAAINFAFKAADAFVAADPLLNDTALDNGVFPFLADQVVKGRLVTSRIFDAAGITGAAKYIHGLMPGFESSAPGAIIGGALAWRMGMGGADKLKWFAGGALANRILSPFLPNLMKDYDQLKAEYSGEVEVPMMKNPTWLLGMTPWEGSKVIGWKPNWYTDLKSRWKESDTLYGSTMRKLIHEPIWPIGVSIGDFIDPYYMERLHYYSRPYPATGGFGEEIPLIGPYVNATIGRIIKPQKTMHQEFLSGGPEGSDEADSPFAIAPPSLRAGLGMMHHSKGNGTMGGMSANFGTFVYSGSKNWAATASENFLYNVQNFTGLAGFVASSVGEKIMPGPRVLPTLETAGRMASQSRAFYDMNLGGLGVFTEAIRRIIPKPPSDRYGMNPIPNMFPNWLPSEYLTGDAYSKILKGELRLPGSAYQSTHTNIRKTMPARASMLGYDIKHSVQYFTGLLTPVLKEEMEGMESGTLIHKQIQDSLAAEGLLIQAEAMVYDVKNDISGHVDAIIRDGTGGTGKRAIEIKSINNKAFQKLDAPKWEHQCLTDINNVIMSNGAIKSIKDISVGEQIRNRYGKEEKVIAKSKRQIKENIYTLLLYGQSNNPIDCTHNHELLCIKTNRCSVSNKTLSSSPCFKGRGHCSECKHKYYETYIPEWVESKNIRVGDFLLRYKPKHGVKKLFQETFDIQNYTTNRSRKIPKIINMDYSIGKLFGYYIAEGSLTKRQVIWSFHIKEKEYTDDIKNALSSIGLNSTLDEQPENNVRNIVCNSTVLASIILDLFSKTTTKKIDRSLFDYNIEFLKGIFDGYMRGDGHITKKNKYILGTASYRLVVDLMDLCIILGHYPGLTIKRQTSCTIKGVRIKTHNLFYRLDFYKDKKKEGFIRDFGDYVGYRVRKIDVRPYDGWVYDIEVENTRSFCLTNIISSNSQLNFYLKQLKLKRGSLLYVNRDNPAQVKTYEVNFSYNRFNKDLNNLRKARQISTDMMREGVNDRFGYSYSWVDRLKILADVAPGSSEFKEAKSLVQQQIKYGLLTQDEINKYFTALKHRQARLRQYELYPRRFAGRIMSPDAQANIDSINEDIKAAAEYSLPARAVGAVWENFTNINSFLTNKFFAFKDPLEHYKAYKLYGKEFTPWDEPYRSFIEPYTRKALSRTDPVTAAVTWGIGGNVFGGPIGGAIGSALGTMYGSVHGLSRILGKAPYIPKEVTDMRNVEDYFDKLKYARNMMMSDLTEGLTKQQYTTAANSTLTAFLSSDQNVANLFRAVPITEKPYIEGWLNVRDENERNKILEFVSPTVGEALKKQWSMSDNKTRVSQYVSNNSDPGNRQRFNFDRSLMDPSVAFEDIKMKSVEDLGYDAHSFGLGWNDQIVRMQDQYNVINSAAVGDQLREFSRSEVSLNAGHVKQALVTALQAYSHKVRAQVYVHGDDQDNFINITVRRDRSKTVINAMAKYSEDRE